MKVLYIAPENTVGTLNLWKKIHEQKGNTCDFITMYPTGSNFEDGICLNLPLISSNSKYINLREKYYKLSRKQTNTLIEKEGYPPTWQPGSKLEQYYFNFRDWLWHFKIEKAIKDFDLYNYDVYHFEWGLDLYRNNHFIKKLNELGKNIVCTYHGQDMRMRGVIPEVDRLSDLNLSSELDLLEKHPNIKYLFLPFDTEQFDNNEKNDDIIRICHSPTNRYFKGSETIIPVCEKLAAEENIEFILIENKPHKETIELKKNCDILIDQIYNRGGWGYGMNSVEAMSLGLVCATEMTQKYIEFIPDHPFVNVNKDNLFETLRSLIDDRDKLQQLKKKSFTWVKKHHSLDAVGNKLYEYYHSCGISIRGKIIK